jgi:tRNA(adenine34) deaminase
MTDGDYIYFMGEALKEAREAASKGEVPVGAVVVLDGRIVGRGHNLKESLRDPTAHAEILAIRDAAGRLGRWRLEGSSLFVTVEPCPMCFGAMIQARVGRVVYGARDPKFGACGSVVSLNECKFNHIPSVEGGVMEEDARDLLRSFFERLR